jgi:hypothetical protein
MEISTGRWLFWAACCLYLLTTAGQVNIGDGVVMLEVTESLVERGSFQIDRDLQWADTNKGWSYFSSGQSVVAVPFYLAGKWVAGLFEPHYRWNIIHLFCALANVVIAALIVWLFFRFAFWLRPDLPAALLASLMLMTSTMLWDYSRNFIREPLASLALLACLYWLARAIREESRMKLRLAGAAFVLMIWTRFELVVTLPILLLVLAWFYPIRPERNRLAQITSAIASFLTAPLLSLPIFLLFNSLKFGSPFKFGYTGLSLTATPLLLGIAGLLISPMHGLLLFAPPVLAGVTGFPELIRKQRPVGILFLALSLFLLIFYSKYSFWSGNFTLGPRLLLPLVPLLLLALHMILGRHILRGPSLAAIALLFCWGFGHQIILVLSDWSVFFTRFLDHVGHDGVLYTPGRFMFSPFELLSEHLRSGHLASIWSDLSRAGLPKALLLLPLLASLGLILSGIRLSQLGGLRALNLTQPGRFLTLPQRRWLVSFLLLGGLTLATVYAERTIWPRGLPLRLFSGPLDTLRAGPVLERQGILLDQFQNPLANRNPAVTLAIWQGYLRIPSYLFNNVLHLMVSGRCRVEIDGQEFLTVREERPGSQFTLDKKADFRRGYHALKILFMPVDSRPYFDLRWSIQDFAFRQSISRDFLFEQIPSALGRILIDLEFYLLLLAVLAFYGALAIWVESFGGEAALRP